MLAINNLEVVYQDVILVLRGVSLEIKKGEIVALLGSNGAGKTTVIRSITGLLDVQNGDITKGSISLDGEDITNLNPSKIVEKGIAQVLEGRRIFSELTVIENLRLGGHTNSNNIKDNIDKVLDLFPILKERSKNTAHIPPRDWGPSTRHLLSLAQRQIRVCCRPCGDQQPRIVGAEAR